MKRIKDVVNSFILLMVDLFIVIAFFSVIFILPLSFVGFLITLFNL